MLYFFLSFLSRFNSLFNTTWRSFTFEATENEIFHIVYIFPEYCAYSARIKVEDSRFRFQEFEAPDNWYLIDISRYMILRSYVVSICLVAIFTSILMSSQLGNLIWQLRVLDYPDFSARWVRLTLLFLCEDVSENWRTCCCHFFFEEKVIWVMTIPDGCKGLGGVDILNKCFCVFSQVVVKICHGLFSEWICTFVSLQRCIRELEHIFFVTISKREAFR